MLVSYVQPADDDGGTVFEIASVQGVADIGDAGEAMEVFITTQYSEGYGTVIFDWSGPGQTALIASGGCGV